MKRKKKYSLEKIQKKDLKEKINKTMIIHKFDIKPLVSKRVN